MRRIALLSACASLLAGSGWAASRLNTAEKRALELTPAVVLVSVKYQVSGTFQVGDEPQTFGPSAIGSTGTGSIYRPDGYIITSAHVVEEARPKDAQAQGELKHRLLSVIVANIVLPTYRMRNKTLAGTEVEMQYSAQLKLYYTTPVLSVLLANGTEYKADIVRYSDPLDAGQDIAILKINGDDLPTVKLGDSTNVYLQAPITVVGYEAVGGAMLSDDSRLTPTITNGHVSALKALVGQKAMIQTDAVVGQGSSGAPVFNDANEVIAVSSRGESGFHFLVPINTAMTIVNEAGAKPESGLFNQLWMAALSSLDAGKCQDARQRLQSVLNILPNLPDAVRLAKESEKCIASESVLERSNWIIYSAAGLVVLAVALLVLARKRSARAMDMRGAQVAMDASYSAVPAHAARVETGAAPGLLTARPTLFISYRRDDTAPYAGRLYDHLSAHFGAERLFMDIDSIRPGDDFVRVLSDRVASCDVLIALIGRQWLTITDSTGRRRLEDPNDFVRIEISSALARKVRVIPVLVDGTRMPGVGDLPQDLASLSRRNAIEISNTMFRHNMAQLIQVIEETIAPRTAPPPVRPFEPSQ